MPSSKDRPPPTFSVRPERPGLLGIIERLQEMLHCHELLWYLAWRDVQVRYKQTVIGLLWAVLQPLLMAAVLYVVFGRWAGLARSADGYFLATLVAYLPWQLFSQAVQTASQSLVTNQELVKRVYFPRAFIPLAPLAIGLVDFLVTFALLIVFLAVTRHAISLNVWCVGPYLLLAVLSAMGAGLWLSALNARFRDVQQAVPFLLQIGFFCTPIVYPIAQVPESWHLLLALNPLASVAEGMRASFLGTEGPTLEFLAVSVLAALAWLGSGLFYFWSTEDYLADVV